jgi:hypothetical protein
MIFYFDLISKRHMLFYLRQVAGAILTLWLQAIKAIIASQILD